MRSLRLIFGASVTKEKARTFLWIAASVLTLDLVTKIAGLLWTPMDEARSVLGGEVQFLLLINPHLIGTIQYKAGLAQGFVLGLALVLLSAGGFATVSPSSRPLHKVIVVLGIAVGASALARMVGDTVPAPSLARVVGLTRAAGSLMLAFFMLRIVLNRRLFIAVCLIASERLRTS